MDDRRRTPANEYWKVVYPPTHGDASKTTRSVTLINRRLHPDSYQILGVNHPDITAIRLKTKTEPITIYNIYNDGTNSLTLVALRNHLDAARQGSPETSHPTQQIWAGDFNRHHPLWDEPRNVHLFTKRNLDQAQQLIYLLAEHELQMCLPPGMPTLEASASKNYTRPDNVFCTTGLLACLTHCSTVPSIQPPITDHFPIFTAFDINIHRPERPPKRNFRATDWEAFTLALAQRLPPARAPKVLHTTDGCDYILQKVATAIQDAIEETVPLSRPSPYSNRWWNSELTRLRKRTKKLSRSHYRSRNIPDHPVHAEYRKVRNFYASEIARAKRDHWQDWLESMTNQAIWKAHKYATTDHPDTNAATVPTLNDPTNPSAPPLTANNDKGRLLFDSFFPSQNVTPQAFDDTQYPDPAFSFTTFLPHQIERAIRRLSPFKAAGPDGVPNAVFKYAASVLIPYLTPLFNASLSLCYFPERWKAYRTIVLRKPNKPDYTKAKAYRGIALLNTMSKILSSCVAEDLVYQAETLRLLPDGQFGGRPGRTTTDAIHTITNFAKTAERQGDVAIFLFLDVQGAFPSVVIPRLLHDMRMLGIPREYTDWIQEKLSNRTTTISFDDYETPPFQITNGIDQGCPLSVILYLFYNAGLLKITVTKDEIAVGFMDDVTLGARAPTFELAIAKIVNMLNRKDGAHEWSLTHNSKFEHDKGASLGTSRRKEPDPNRPGKSRRIRRPNIIIGEQTVKTTSTVKYLGVILDEELRFNEHASYALAKGMKWAMQVRRLARPSGGIPPKFMRLLLHAAVIPKMLYGAELFCANKLDSQSPTSGFLGQMGRVQRMLALQITGAMRSTATDTLDVHADLLPFKLLVKKICYRALLRLATLPPNHPLHNVVNGRLIKHHATPIHHLRKHFDVVPKQLEKIPIIRRDPKRQYNIPVHIDPSKDEAIYTFLIRPSTPVRIYTDGSGYGDAIGAAAIMQRPGRPDIILQYHLGPATHHTVFEGELVGILLAFYILSSHQIQADTIIFTDNQASLQAINSSSTKSAFYLVREVQRRFAFLTNPARKQRVNVKFQWSPAHIGIPGNEKVDSFAKEASLGTSSPLEHLPDFLRKPLPISASALKQEYNRILKMRHAKLWSLSPRAKRVAEYDPSAPSPQYRKLLESLPRKSASILTQLRTGHVPLNAYLFRIKRAESPLCPFCLTSKETIYHFLVKCAAFQSHRAELVQKLRHNSTSVPYLLGQKKAIPHTLKFVHATKRFFKTSETSTSRSSQNMGGAQESTPTGSNPIMRQQTLDGYIHVTRQNRQNPGRVNLPRIPG